MERNSEKLWPVFFWLRQCVALCCDRVRVFVAMSLPSPPPSINESVASDQGHTEEGYVRDLVENEDQESWLAPEPAPGFETLESLDKWPTELLRRIFGGGGSSDSKVMSFLYRRRLEALLQHGLVLHTDFSGKGSVEMAFRLLDIAGKDRRG